MKIIIVGGGRIGSELATLLTDANHHVNLVEMDEERAQFLANNLECTVLHGDGTDVAVLDDAGVQKADCIVPVASDDKVNLMVAKIAESLGVPKITVRVNEPQNALFFSRIENIQTLSLTKFVTKELYETIEQSTFTRFVGKGNVQDTEVYELIVTESSAEKLKKIEKKKEITIGAIYREKKLVSSSVPKPGDVIYLIGPRNKLLPFIK